MNYSACSLHMNLIQKHSLFASQIMRLVTVVQCTSTFPAIQKIHRYHDKDLKPLNATLRNAQQTVDCITTFKKHEIETDCIVLLSNSVIQLQKLDFQICYFSRYIISVDGIRSWRLWHGFSHFNHVTSHIVSHD